MIVYVVVSGEIDIRLLIADAQTSQPFDDALDDEIGRGSPCGDPHQLRALKPFGIDLIRCLYVIRPGARIPTDL